MSPIIEPSPAKPVLLAFYLPQFHPIPENDVWWGAGFTEWHNVVQARVLYEGQYQPHIPGELGFYDLRLPEVRRAQAALAAGHGIGGFCYYHYWFNGRRILELPFNEVLRTGEPRFPFCLCWANEPWTRNWDGGNRDVLIAQRYSPDDDRTHIRHLIRAFRDERYIRILDRPVFFIYNVSALPHPTATIEVWREECESAGVGAPYLVQFETFGLIEDPATRGCDASAEFLPHHARPTLVADGKFPVDDPEWHNEIFRYDDLAEAQLRRELPRWRRYQCVVPGWDNTPRKPRGSANLFLGATPDRYEHWVTAAVKRASRERHEFILLNAWNEWAEGAHLEPDVKYGRAYLEATARAVDVDPAALDLATVAAVDPELHRDAGSVSEELRELFEAHRASSAREIEHLLREVQVLEDALSGRPIAPTRSEQVDPAELMRQLDAVQRRASVRAANAIGRLPVAGRAIRTLGILRRDWRSL